MTKPTLATDVAALLSDSTNAAGQAITQAVKSGGIRTWTAGTEIAFYEPWAAGLNADYWTPTGTHSAPRHQEDDTFGTQPTANIYQLGGSDTLSLSVANIPSAAGKVVQSLTFEYAGYRNSTAPQVTVNGTNKFNYVPNMGGYRTWAGGPVTVAVDAADPVIQFVNGDSAFAFTKVTLLVVDPDFDDFDLNDLAIYNGLVYKSMTDNNPDTPGASEFWILAGATA